MLRSRHIPLILSVFAVSISAIRAAEATTEEEFALRDGDRVAFIGNTFLERERHYGHIESALTVRYPGRRVQFRNMSWPGDTVDIQLRPLNFGSLQEHLEAYRPTVAILGYGLNEAFEGPEKVAEFIAGYNKILDTLSDLDARDIVLIGPNPHEAKGDPLPDPSEHNRSLETYVKAIERLADEREVHFIDLFDTFGRGEEKRIPFTDNGIHLNDYGYRLAAREIDRGLHASRASWSVELEAGEGALGEPSGVEIKDLETAPSSVSFTATSASLPPPPLGDIETPGGGITLSGDLGRGRLGTIQRLSPGRYELKIDGETVAFGDEKDWEAGVAWSTGPDYRRLEELRQAAILKSEYFFYRWRAHNGEYIYGRRASSSGDGYGSGNSGNEQFPEEMAEFERLIAEQEDRIFELSTPRGHRYELEKVDR